MQKHPLVLILVTAAILGAVFFVVVFAASFFTGDKRSAAKASSLVASERVGLIKIEGVLMSAGPVVEELKHYAEDPSIRAIIIRIDSPGGGVVVSQEIFNAVQSAKKEKKIVVSMGTVAASGGYYVAAAADKIVANPGTLTGSIGVIMEFASIEKLLDKIGVKGQVIKAGEYKDIASPFREMLPQERKLLQNVIDDVHNQFIEAVLAGRNQALPEGKKLSQEEVRAVADGRIFTGRQAYALRLVDEMGDLDESIRIAGDLAGIKGRPQVIEKKKKTKFLEYFKEEAATWITDVLARAAGKSSATLQYIYR